MKSKFLSDILFQPKELSLALLIMQVFWQQIPSAFVYLEVSLFHPHFYFYLFFLEKQLFSFFNWGIVVLQRCVSFYCTAKWSSLCYTAGFH